MSPRSAEFIAAAKQRLQIARGAAHRHPSSAISLAYYGMLYAARAALSERKTYATTHTGTWNLFQREFVDTDQFDAELLTEVRKVQPEREDADYEAWAAPREEAERVIELADRFVAAVEKLIDQATAS